MPRINAAYDTFRLPLRSFLYEIFALTLAIWLVEARSRPHTQTPRESYTLKNQLTQHKQFPSDQEVPRLRLPSPPRSQTDAGLSYDGDWRGFVGFGALGFACEYVGV
jgi:hypothetical protein